MSTISENIKRLRAEKKMTLEELADKVGTTKQTVYKYENDMIKDVPYKKIYAFAKALGVTPQQLMGLEDKWAGTPVTANIGYIGKLDDTEIIIEPPKTNYENERVLRIYNSLMPDQQERVIEYMVRMLTGKE